MTASTTNIVENRTIKLDRLGRMGILLTFFMIFLQLAGLLISAGHVGLIVFTLAGSFILGSWWSLVPAGMMSALVVVRTLMEDRILQQELKGYSDYAASTPFRLLPVVW